jgi:hypothetical protein
VIEQVAVVPLKAAFDEQLAGLRLGSVTLQVTVPVGVIESTPLTVAVNVKLPPVTTPEELSLTKVTEAAVPTATEPVPLELP